MSDTPLKLDNNEKNLTPNQIKLRDYLRKFRRRRLLHPHATFNNFFFTSDVPLIVLLTLEGLKSVEANAIISDLSELETRRQEMIVYFTSSELENLLKKLGINLFQEGSNGVVGWNEAIIVDGKDWKEDES